MHHPRSNLYVVSTFYHKVYYFLGNNFTPIKVIRKLTNRKIIVSAIIKALNVNYTIIFTE
jgi:hypothetical protein